MEGPVKQFLEELRALYEKHDVSMALGLKREGMLPNVYIQAGTQVVDLDGWRLGDAEDIQWLLEEGGEQ